MYQIINRNNLLLPYTSCLMCKSEGTLRTTQYTMHKKAFTLIEMLVVLVMVSLISLAVFTTLSNGIKIWQRLNQATGQEEINIFFEGISRELRNSFGFYTIKFQGEEDKVSFATLITVRGISQVQENIIGQVLYNYDRAIKQVARERRNYSQVYKGLSGSKQALLEGIDYLKFSYYFYDEKAKEYIWLDEWQEEGLPLAVRIEFEFYNGRQTEKIIRTIDIPSSQS